MFTSAATHSPAEPLAQAVSPAPAPCAQLSPSTSFVNDTAQLPSRDQLLVQTQATANALYSSVLSARPAVGADSIPVLRHDRFRRRSRIPLRQFTNKRLYMRDTQIVPLRLLASWSGALTRA
jgi:hypothetical protein